MARFVALPVGLGDAFYLERGKRSVLVDGGRSATALPNLMKRYLGRDNVEILVCTHNDADHAAGIIGFLDAGFTCEEIWLPGRWLAALNELLDSAQNVYQAIIDQAHEFFVTLPKGVTPPASLMEAAELLWHRDNSWMETVPVNADQLGQVDGSLYNMLVDAKRWDNESRILVGWPWARGDEPGAVVASAAIEAAHRIKEIALKAFDLGIPVRWFEHRPGAPSGGLAGFLHPVGAQEIAAVYPAPGRLFRHLALSAVNRESLVLYSPGDDEAPGVLFCADSDLAGMTPPIHGGDVVTVPHHGSAHNVGAYDVIAGSGTPLESLHWVRSDNRSRQRPCAEYVALDARRYCTICRVGPQKQHVGLYSDAGKWRATNSTRRCCC